MSDTFIITFHQSFFSSGICFINFPFFPLYPLIIFKKYEDIATINTTIENKHNFKEVTLSVEERNSIYFFRIDLPTLLAQIVGKPATESQVKTNASLCLA